ncbi:uncharacterized protein [Diabrotica undecimpunctata]|uniref:uncharacterized protein n=1 Tax=Diabrotica undecimpunctata TaxID=50387 RepID=UPI003B635235
MSIRELLKIAHENVVYCADHTWSNGFSCYQETNMNLLLRETGLTEPNYVGLRPRTVKDCIPNSKLAKYSDYEYHDSRELSYRLEDFKKTSCEYDFSGEVTKEPWMLKEVDEYFKYYTDFYKTPDSKEEIQKTNRFKYLTNFELPFMKCNSLAEYFLKHQITKDSTKKLWDVESLDSKMIMFRTLRSFCDQRSVLVYKSPAGRFYVSECDDVSSELKEDYYEWLKHDVNGESNIHLSSLNEEVRGDTVFDADVESMQNRRLYSAVLQGFSSNKIPTTQQNPLPLLGRSLSDSSENTMEKLGSTINFCKRKVDSDDTFKNNKFFSNCSAPAVSSTGVDGVSSFQNEKVSPVNAVPQHTFCTFSQPIRYRPSYNPSSYQFPPFYMFVHNTLQQTYVQPVYNPIYLHRSVPVSMDRNILHANCSHTQSQYFSCKYTTNIQKTKSGICKSRSKRKYYLRKNKIALLKCSFTREDKRLNKIYSMPTVTDSDCSLGEVYKDTDELVSKIINLVLDDSLPDCSVPVSKSHSDELERQALEQYNNSDENVFQDLERQAAEEYEDNSENYSSPPNCRLLFGGLYKKLNYYVF